MLRPVVHPHIGIEPTARNQGLHESIGITIPPGCLRDLIGGELF